MTSFKITVQRLLLAGLVAGGAATAMAQSAQPASPAQANAPAAAQERHGPHGRGAHHHGDRQAAMAKRQAELKQQLQITAAQEPAWNLFTAAMLPEGRPAMRQEREAMNALTTPQRIERMRALRAQRDAAMERRADATLKLYAALSAEQQKVFDARSARHHGHGHHGGPRGAQAAPHNG